MKLRWPHHIVIEATSLTYILFITEGYILLNQIRYSTVTNWLTVLMPIVWINISIINLFIFFRLIQSSLRFQFIRNMGKNFTSLWILAATVFFLLYSLIQGSLIIDFSGGMTPRLSVIDSLIGYGPTVILVPTSSIGFILTPYIFASAITISIFAGLLVSLMITLRTLGYRFILSPLTGFTVICPTCMLNPFIGFLSGYLTITGILSGAVSASIASTLFIASTILYIVSLALMWTALIVISRRLGPRQPLNIAGPGGL